MNLNNDLIQLIKKDREEEIKDNKKDILYNLKKGYLDFKTIEKTNDEVKYKR